MPTNPHPILGSAEIKPGTWCMLGKHSSNRALLKVKCDVAYRVRVCAKGWAQKATAVEARGSHFRHWSSQFWKCTVRTSKKPSWRESGPQELTLPSSCRPSCSRQHRCLSCVLRRWLRRRALVSERPMLVRSYTISSWKVWQKFPESPSRGV